MSADPAAVLAAIVLDDHEWHTRELRRVALEYRRMGWREGWKAAMEANRRDVARALQWRPAGRDEVPAGAEERRSQERPEIIHAAWAEAGVDLAAAS